MHDNKAPTPCPDTTIPVTNPILSGRWDQLVYRVAGYIMPAERPNTIPKTMMN